MVVAVAVHAFGDLPEEVQAGVGDAHVPAECYAGAVILLVEQGFEDAAQVAVHRLPQAALRFHVSVEAVDLERWGKMGYLGGLVHSERDGTAELELVVSQVIDEFHVGPPLAHGSAREVIAL